MIANKKIEDISIRLCILIFFFKTLRDSVPKLTGKYLGMIDRYSRKILVR